MDRGSLLGLASREPAMIRLKPIKGQSRWTLMERILGFISPPRLDPTFKGDAPLSDTWDYHYRTNRRGRDYPTPDEDACIVRGVKPKPRTSVAIFELHIAACRQCSEALLDGGKQCTVGEELQRRLDRMVFHRRPSESLLRR